MNHNYNTFINKNLHQLLNIYLKESSNESVILLVQISEDNQIKVFTQSIEKLSLKHQDEIKQIKERTPELLKLDRHVLTCSTQKEVFPVEEFYLLVSDSKDDYLLRGYQQKLTGDSYTFEFETFLDKMDKNGDDVSLDVGEKMEFETGGIPEISRFKGEWNIHKTIIGQNFLRACRLAVTDDKYFETFRSKLDYENIIIGGNNERAKAYTELHPEIGTEEEVKKILKKCDEIGGPNIRDSGYSTLTLRNYHTYMDLKKYFGELKDKKIIEIGQGHGGLCHLITEMRSDYQSYTLVDLPVVNELAEKYLSKFEITENGGTKSIKYMNSEQVIPRKYDLLVGEYSFSELDPLAQKYYLENVVKYCQGAYLAMNVWEPKMKMYLKTYLEKIFREVKEYEEEPKSDYPNYIWVCYK